VHSGVGSSRTRENDVVARDLPQRVGERPATVGTPALIAKPWYGAPS